MNPKSQNCDKYCINDTRKLAAYSRHSSPFGGGGVQAVTLPVHLFIWFLGQISFIALVKNELVYQCDGQTNM